ncbi:MAG: transglycosylase domain-containing protein [Rhizobiaceae bacterium]
MAGIAVALGALALPDALPTFVSLADRFEDRAFSTGLPTVEELGDLATRCQVTKVFGPETLLCPQALPLSAFSPHLASALVASEDRRFLSHGGVDKPGILRALAGFAHILPKSGGSTITQQLARTLFLDPADDVFMRKAREWVIARRLESALAKPQLLAAYLNVAPHAAGLFGFESASRFYFGKHASELSVMESAMLVAMLPAPNDNDPRSAAARLEAATIRVIGLMREQEFISAEEAATAAAQAKRRIGGKLFTGSRKLAGTARRPYEYRRLRDLALEQAKARGIEQPARLFLTLDPRFQEMADAIARGTPRGYDTSVLLASKDSDLLAIAGPDYAAVQFNAAFHGERSVGSLAKTIVLAAALETPELTERMWSTAPLDGYSPREDSRWCRGRMRIADALAHSCNRPFVRMAALTRTRVSQLTRDFGLAAPDNPLLTPTGGVHGNAYSVARMFAAYANGGWLKEPNAIAGALDADGRVIDGLPAPLPRRVLPPKIAQRMAVELRRPVTAEHGTAVAAAGKHRAAHVSGKTGTSNDSRDAWFAGFTEDFIGVVAAQSKGRGGALAGSGYPAASFGGIVDAYWTQKNWQTANADAPALGPVWRWTGARLWTLAPEAGRLIAMILLAAALLKSRPRRKRVRVAPPPLPAPAYDKSEEAIEAPRALAGTPEPRKPEQGAAARAMARPLAGTSPVQAYFGVSPADALKPGTDA